MPTFLVTISPGTPAVPVIGTDETDAVAGALQSLDSLRDVIALCADTVPEMAAVPDTARAAFIRAIPHPKRADCPWHPSGGMVCAHCDDIGLAGVA